MVDHKRVDRAKSRVMKNQQLKDFEGLKDEKGIERVVKQAVYGEEQHGGFIRASAAQRELVPVRNSKQDFVQMTGSS